MRSTLMGMSWVAKKAVSILSAKAMTRQKASLRSQQEKNSTIGGEGGGKERAEVGTVLGVVETSVSDQGHIPMRAQAIPRG